LPPGVSLSAGVISGTPTAERAAQPFVATADDAAEPDASGPSAPQHLTSR